MSIPIRVPGLLVLALGLSCGVAAWAQGTDSDKGLSPGAQARKDKKFTPTGKVRFEGTNVSVGVGVTWGKGTLEFDGETHPISVRGLGLVGVGGAKMVAEGTVFNLEKLEDFPGTYGSVDASAAFLNAGAGGVTMRKGGVYMTLNGNQTGVQLAVGGGGLTFKLLDEKE